MDQQHTRDQETSRDLSHAAKLLKFSLIVGGVIPALVGLHTQVTSRNGAVLKGRNLWGDPER